MTTVNLNRRQLTEAEERHAVMLTRLLTLTNGPDLVLSLLRSFVSADTAERKDEQP